MSISSTLQKAAKLQEKIEALRKDLTGLLGKARQELASAPVPEIPSALRKLAQARGKAPRPAAKSKPAAQPTPKRGGASPKATKPTAATAAPRGKAVQPTGAGRASLAGKQRAASPSGPLAPAVVRVLKANGKPMRVADIVAGLLKNGYAFNAAEPKKNLAARIYRLSGVKQVGQGLFAQG